MPLHTGCGGLEVGVVAWSKHGEVLLLMDMLRRPRLCFLLASVLLPLLLGTGTMVLPLTWCGTVEMDASIFRFFFLITLII